MKGNQIDDLFRQKLSHQKLTPPPAAWGAIAENLPGKKKKGAYFWMSIAASIMLICTIGWLLMTKSGSQATIDNQTEASITPKPTTTSPVQAEQPVEKLVAQVEETSAIIKEPLQEPTTQSLVAQTNPDPVSLISSTEEPGELTAQVSVPEIVLEINLINIQTNHLLSPKMTAGKFSYDMLMPLELSDYYILYTEELRLAPKKKRFRVLNGIISIAKEVNTGKLSFSELRNAKNNFVEADLKYGSKEEESDSGDEPPKSPEKD